MKGNLERTIMKSSLEGHTDNKSFISAAVIMADLAWKSVTSLLAIMWVTNAVWIYRNIFADIFGTRTKFVVMEHGFPVATMMKRNRIIYNVQIL